MNLQVEEEQEYSWGELQTISDTKWTDGTKEKKAKMNF